MLFVCEDTNEGVGVVRRGASASTTNNDLNSCQSTIILHFQKIRKCATPEFFEFMNEYNISLEKAQQQDNWLPTNTIGKKRHCLRKVLKIRH